MATRTPPSTDSATDIAVSVTAKSKAGRYFSAAELRRHVRESRGTWYYDPKRNLHLLKTGRHIASHGMVHIHVDADAEPVQIVTQSCDHFERGQLERPTSVPASLRRVQR